MGKDLRGKELGVGIVQQTDGLYVARFTDPESSERKEQQNQSDLNGMERSGVPLQKGRAC